VNAKSVITYTVRDGAIVFGGADWTWTLRPDQRWINAVTKARQYGHYCWASGPRRYKIRSHSDKAATPHQVYLTTHDGPHCDCQGFWRTGCCWHCGCVYRRLMRESRPLRLSDFASSPYELLDGDDWGVPTCDEWGEVIVPGDDDYVPEWEGETAPKKTAKGKSRLEELYDAA
jgi:hypothetical protein